MTIAIIFTVITLNILFIGLFEEMASKLVDLNNESNRLSTFVGWPPSSIVSSNTLAAAGFHYIKLTDTVIIIILLYFMRY